jgi:hypothetical protein
MMRRAWFFPLLAMAGAAASCLAHTVPIARALVEFPDDGGMRLTLHADISSFLIGSPNGDVPDEQIAELRGSSPDRMRVLIEQAVSRIKESVRIVFDGRMIPLDQVNFPEAQEVRRTLEGEGVNFVMPVSIQAAPPAGARLITFQFPSDLGTVALSVLKSGRPPVHQVLEFGQTSWPYVLGSGDFHAATEQWVRKTAVGLQYLTLGFEHILPKGLDHILFVLGLFLLGTRVGPLLWQVTAFTVAHSVTLALSMYDVIALPGSIVEPLIALSICCVAVENVATSRLHAWRPIVVFVFGLLHGLGFAGVLAELGLPRGDLALGLITFNVGVELGQLAVIAGAMLLVGWFRHRPWYRTAITIPASCLIAGVGAYWTIQRVLDGMTG